MTTPTATRHVPAARWRRLAMASARWGVWAMLAAAIW
jgi:hypothetical protein